MTENGGLLQKVTVSYKKNCKTWTRNICEFYVNMFLELFGNLRMA